MGNEGDAHRHSTTGRNLLSAIPHHGGTIRDAGSSDWVVYPQNKKYTPAQTYFLHYFVQGIESALTGSTLISPDTMKQWTHERHAQIENGEFILIVHQIDIVGLNTGRST